MKFPREIQGSNFERVGYSSTCMSVEAITSRPKELPAGRGD